MPRLAAGRRNAQPGRGEMSHRGPRTREQTAHEWPLAESKEERWRNSILLSCKGRLREARSTQSATRSSSANPLGHGRSSRPSYTRIHGVLASKSERANKALFIRKSE